jgi:hypothetical protein
MQAGAQEEPGMVLIEGAFAAFQSGDFNAHDELLRQGLIDLQDRADTIVLAQASMARVMDQLPPELQSKVLSSPDLAIQALMAQASPREPA